MAPTTTCPTCGADGVHPGVPYEGLLRCSAHRDHPMFDAPIGVPTPTERSK